ncbi:MAG: hypothetical protein JRN15_03250, partial [Nitrososphaerota archaeon]|nr:hypothetical protein [Nitrososphaerota archaeon]
MSRIHEFALPKSAPVHFGSYFSESRVSPSMNEQDPASPRAITKRKVVPRTTAVGSLLVIIGWFASILFYVLLLDVVMGMMLSGFLRSDLK